MNVFPISLAMEKCPGPKSIVIGSQGAVYLHISFKGLAKPYLIIHIN